MSSSAKLLRPAGWCLEPLMLLAAVSLGACNKDQAPAQECRHDPDCGNPSLACVAGACTTKVDTYPTVAVEIAPPSDAKFAATELVSVTLSSETALVANGKVNVTASVQSPEADLFSSQGHVLLTRPSLIPGKAAVSTAGELAGGSVTFSVPADALGTTASLTLLPTSAPSPQPPVIRSVALATQVAVALPTRSELASYTGVLLSALGDPAPSYFVRGFPVGAGVSATPITSVTLTGQDGGFTVFVDPMTRRGAGDTPMWLEFWEASEGSVSPRLHTDAVNPTNPGDQYGKTQWRLPAYVAPTLLRFRVGGGESVSTPIKDATLRFRTNLPSAGSGQAYYSQEGKTDDVGQVDVPLVPGTLDEARIYDVAVVPPPDSPFSGKCLTGFPVTAPALTNTDVPVASVIHLERKWQVGGHVRDARGQTITNATVTATRLASDADHGCLAGLVADSTSATTDASGSYALLLQTGTYRLEVDPPAGAQWPRLSATAAGSPFDVGADAALDFQLPSGVVASGTVRGPSGEPVANADLRFFQVSCPSASCGSTNVSPPELLANGRSDAGGLFRVVLPAP